MIFSKNLLGKPLTCTVTRLDEGIHILLVGGDRSHIGAVSICEPGGTPETILRAGHKEPYISTPWSQTISQATGSCCTVACGIHYDNATAAQIAEIMEAVRVLLDTVLSAMQK